jgi:pimeloyl-ACP methyl ester carboxylesterase
MPKSIQATLDSGRLFALTAGSPQQPALILLHGWPQSSAIFESIVDRLGEHFFVLAFDLPGVGQSTASMSAG